MFLGDGSVLFLCPCHSTPFYSHFHFNISARYGGQFSAEILEQSMGSRNRGGIWLSFWYDNWVPTRFLASIDCSKIPAQNFLLNSCAILLSVPKFCGTDPDFHPGNPLTSSTFFSAFVIRLFKLLNIYYFQNNLCYSYY
jgi:hypothetical protein